MSKKKAVVKKKKVQRVTNKPGVSYRESSEKPLTKADIDKFLKDTRKKK